MFALCVNCFAISKQTPFTLAYCLDGSSQDISTREISYSSPAIGYITFYSDKFVIDNKETYVFLEERNGTKSFQGKTLYSKGVEATPVIFVDPYYSDVVLFICVSDAILKSQIHLMEIDKFQALLNRNSGMSNSIFIENADNYNSKYKANKNSGGKEYYKERYGYKDCNSCYGSTKCRTCNGKGWIRDQLGLNSTIDCPNCTDGKCSTCNGKGKVYGVK